MAQQDGNHKEMKKKKKKQKNLKTQTFLPCVSLAFIPFWHLVGTTTSRGWKLLAMLTNSLISNADAHQLLADAAVRDVLHP